MSTDECLLANFGTGAVHFDAFFKQIFAALLARQVALMLTFESLAAFFLASVAG